jgi:hypothetical protein
VSSNSNPPFKPVQGYSKPMNYRQNSERSRTNGANLPDSNQSSSHGTPSFSRMKEGGGIGLRRYYNSQHLAKRCPMKPGDRPSSGGKTPRTTQVQQSPAASNVKPAVTRTYVNRVFRSNDNSEPTETSCKIIEATGTEHDVIASCHKVAIVGGGS